MNDHKAWPLAADGEYFGLNRVHGVSVSGIAVRHVSTHRPIGVPWPQLVLTCAVPQQPGHDPAGDGRRDHGYADSRLRGSGSHGSRSAVPGPPIEGSLGLNLVAPTESHWGCQVERVWGGNRRRPFCFSANQVYSSHRIDVFFDLNGGQMVKMFLRDRESIQEAVRRFRKIVERSGLKKEMRKREVYEKPSLTKRRAKLRAVRRAKTQRKP